MRYRIINKMNISDKRMQLENELLLTKNLIKKEKYEQALKKLEFLKTISKRNQRILSLVSIAESHLQQKREPSSAVNLGQSEPPPNY